MSKRNTKIIKLSETQLNHIVRRVIGEDKNWMQDASEDIEKRGTEDVFHDYCVNRGYKNGCSRGCWEHAENDIDSGKLDGSVWGRRVGLAKAYCESRH